MQDIEFQQLVAIVTAGEPPRVWSLLVTLFGDVVQPSGSAISGAKLNRILQLAGLKPEAIRVAIHRLRKEGWIESERQGRESNYRLTKWGAAQIVAASPLVYATGSLADKAWLLLADPKQTDPIPALDALWLTANVALSRREPDASADLVTLPVTPQTALPAWVRQSVCDPRQCAQWADLSTRFARISEALSRARALSATESITLRVLVVHAWRRLVLRLALLPDHVFPQDWQGPDARRHFHALLTHLPREMIDQVGASD